jgi:hypothetical protein
MDLLELSDADVALPLKTRQEALAAVFPQNLAHKYETTALTT